MPFILDCYNLDFLHYNCHFLIFVIHLKCVSKTKYIKKRRFHRWKSTTFLNRCFASKPLFCCHLCSVLQICSTLKGLAKRKYLPCAACFLKHIMSKMAISRQGGFVPLNKTLTYGRRAECRDLPHILVFGAGLLIIKYKCHNTFS